MADTLKQAYRDLVIANRVLANQGVVDAYGHVSVRHPEKPDHFLLSRSRSPFLVDASDILEFTLDGKVVGDDNRYYRASGTSFSALIGCFPSQIVD